MSTTDTSLRSLSFSEGKLRPTLAPDVYNYMLDVPAEVTQLTVQAEPSDRSSKVNVMPGDADPSISGLQLDVETIEAIGVTITVTAENGDAVRYFVGVDTPDE